MNQPVKRETVEYFQSHRSLMPALLRGLRGRCPHCGKGHMFRKFLKVVDHCPVCNEELFHHRADDAPAYFVIAIVGHVIVALVFIVEVTFWPPLWLEFAIWLPATILLALVLLQPVKGAIVGVQWACRMHGFDPNASPDE